MLRLSIAAAGLVSFLTVGCSGADHEDLRAWMQEEASGMKGKVTPIPEVKAFPVIAYQGETLPPPFSASKLIAAESSKDMSAPDSERPRQPLESFPLESLRLQGVIRHREGYLAIIGTPFPNKPKHVKVGEFMGQNFGKIVEIDRASVRIVETVRDPNGVWSDREVVLAVPREGGQK